MAYAHDVAALAFKYQVTVLANNMYVRHGSNFTSVCKHLIALTNKLCVYQITSQDHVAGQNRMLRSQLIAMYSTLSAWAVSKLSHSYCPRDKDSL